MSTDLFRFLMPKNDQVYHCYSNFISNDTANFTLLNVFYMVSYHYKTHLYQYQLYNFIAKLLWFSPFFVGTLSLQDEFSYKICYDHHCR